MDFLRSYSNMIFKKFMFYFKCELWFWAALMWGHLYLLRWNNQDPLYSNLNLRFSEAFQAVTGRVVVEGSEMLPTAQKSCDALSLHAHRHWERGANERVSILLLR